MSGNASTWARAQIVGNGSAKALLKEYAHWASEDYSTWVSNPTLIAAMEMDIKTIRAARDRLVELGFLVETKRRSGGTGNIVVYQMIAPPGSTVVQALDRRTNETVSLSPPSIEEFQAKQDQKRSPSKSGPPKGNQKRSPSENGAPPNLDSRGTKNGAQGVPDFPEGVPKTDPDFNDLGLEKVECGDAREKTAHTPTVEKQNLEPATSGFERFWDAWPSASGRKQAKAICESHWLAKGLDDDAELIVMHVRAMKLTQHWKTGGDPTPIRYLEQKRWRDGEPEPVVAPVLTGAAEGPWWESSPEVIEARGAELSVRPRKPDEPIAWYRVLVVQASREKAAVDFVLKDARRFNSQALFDFAVHQFGDSLMPTDFYAS
jgi:hypothetical protein